ncbi:MAG: DUF2184 domain-containing protein [Alphaproteobacteria bacterium]|nr:DUF2184 domain-containing protein [Alphaproteobacteria bacterium]
MFSAPSYALVHPSYVMPETVLQYSQASGAFALLAGENPQARLSEGDKYVYLKKANIRTKTNAGQAAFNQLNGVSITMDMMSTPTYLLRMRAEYDHHDTAAAANWGMGLDNAYRMGMRQGIFQSMRNGLLYGFNPSFGEGIVNGVGTTSVNLPADQNGNTTIATYDNGALAFFLLQIVSALKSRTLQLGMPVKVTVIGPQRVLGAMEYQNIVQLTQFQRTGAGTETTKGVLQNVLGMNGDTLEWGYDDTLIGKGAGGNDLIIISVPELDIPDESGINTNEFAKVTPSLRDCNSMFCDMAAPREIRSPLAGGATDVVSELRTTPGWTIRPEATTLLSAKYQ